MIKKLTKEQAVILSGFTGVLHGTFNAFHADVEIRMGEPILTHEMADPEFKVKLKELYRPDFIELATVEPEAKKFNDYAVFSLDQERQQFESNFSYESDLNKVVFCESENKYKAIAELQHMHILTEITGRLNAHWGLWQKARKGVSTWVAVTNEDPPLNTNVLIAWDDAPDVEPEMDFMDVCMDTGNHYWSNYESDAPTHWMHLPKMIGKVA